MKCFIPLILAIIGVIHFSHVTVITGFPDTYMDTFFFEDSSNGTNATTVAPGDTTDNDTTTNTPAEDTTTYQPSNETTTAPSSNDTTSSSPATDTTSAQRPATTKKSPGNSGSKGSSFDGASFAGGIALGFGVLIIVGVVYTFYRKRATQHYNAM